MSNILDSARATSDSVKQHGLAVVLSIVLCACLLFFAWSQWQTSEDRADKWREIQRQDISELRKSLDEANTFTKTKMADTIERNSEALEGLIDELRR